MNRRTGMTTRKTESLRRLWRCGLLAVAALAVLGGAAGPARPAFPGANGLIAFTSTRDGGFPELFLLDETTLQATKVAEVAAGGGVPENPVWSPDGTRIVFSRAGALEIYEASTGGLQTIQSDPAQQPAWSPDGSMLAFTRFDDGNRGIWRMNADGTGVVRLTDGEHQDPAWSPDGGSIAFTKRRHFSEAGFFLADSVYAMNPDGTGQVRMDHEVYCCSQADPAWSPDGQKIALTQDIGGPQRIGVLEVDQNEGSSPVTDFERDFAPAWSPDGTKIVFERGVPGGRALFTVTPGAPGSPTQLTQPTGSPPAFDSSPDWQPLSTTGAAPTCSIGVTRVEEAAAQASLVVHCRNPTALTYTLDYASIDAPGHTGTAQPLLDYTPTAGNIAVPPGETRSPIHVSVIGDIVPEPHETLFVRISSNDFLLDNDAAQATATIVDDDGFGITVESTSVPEGNGGSTDVPVRVRLSHPADQLVDVFVHAVTPAGARSGYHDVNFAPGETEKVITYPVSGDSEPEGDERVEFAPVSWLVTDANLQSGFLTIVDDDVPTTLSVGDLTVAEGDGDATVVVTRTKATDPVAFDFATESGTATEGDDYGSAGGRVSFLPGELTATFPIPIADDALDEAGETFGVRISNPANATVADGLGLVTITDDDAEPALTIDDVSVAEGDAGTATAQFTIRLSTPSGKTVRLRYATADGTATAPGDYTAVPPTELVIPQLATAVTATVDVLGDTDPEGNETFRVELSGVENATVSDGEAIGTIIDDEPAATLSIADVTVAEGNTGTRPATFVVTRSHTAGDVSFRFLTEDGSATPLADYFPNGGTVTFAAASPTATFTVDVAGDVLDEVDETFGVRLSNPVDAFISDEFALATIADDDAAPSLSIDDVQLAEGNTGTTTARFTVTLSAPSASTVRVTAATADGTAIAPGDYTAVAPTAITFAGTTTQTVDVTVNGDGDPEADETFTVQLSGAVNATVADGVGLGTIRDDEAPPNDNFADAAMLLPGTTAFDTSFASTEPGEPGLEFLPGRPSVWYRLTTGQGGVALRLDPGITPKQIAVYTGSSLNALTLVERFQSTGPFTEVALEFASEPGQLYYIQILAPSALSNPFLPGIGAGTLTTTLYPAPTNDNFADAAMLLPGTTAFDTSFASTEPGEPGLATTTPERHPSAWYRMSPGLGTVSLRAESGRPRQVSVYTGTSLAALALLARASTPSPFPGAPGDPTAPALDLAFTTGCAATYYVQALGPSAFQGSSFDPAAGQGTLAHGFVSTPVPPNDAFANATTLPVGRTTLPASWWTCMSAQPGEPAHGGAPAARSLWYRATVGSGRLTVDSPGNRVAVYQGTTLAGLVRVADGASGQASVLTSGGTYLIAVDGGSGTTVDLAFTAGDVTIGTAASLTTDDGPVGATQADPIETTISGTAASPKSIFETQGPTAPTAWSFLLWKVEISAPPLTPPPADPFYTITFRIDGTLVPPFTGPVSTRPPLQVFKDGQPIAASCSGNPRPDPCVFLQSTVASSIPGDQQDRVITVRTSRASEWKLGVARTTRGTVAGLLRPSSGGDADFLVASNGTTVAGALSYGFGSERFVATTVNALGIDGNRAWLAGVGRDGRTFVAYAEDNGPGSSDRFRLWIAGVERTAADGRLSSGDLAVRP